MTNIWRKHILCKIHDISHGKNTTCKLCKKPKNIVMKVIVIH